LISDDSGQLPLEFQTTPAPADPAQVESAFRRIHRQMKPRTAMPRIHAAFIRSAGANHNATLENGTLQVQVSDLFEDAPDDVVDALAAILLAKLYRKKVDPAVGARYRRYLMTPAMRERSRQARIERGRQPQTTPARGRCYDLVDLFETLNEREFGGTLRRPTLSWTLRRTRQLMGRYDFDHDIIYISRSLDGPDVPEHVVRYIMFHEMLHMKHGTRYENDREIVHSPEFRREERRFEFYDAATEWLNDH
jgi:hypothetical protein